MRTIDNFPLVSIIVPIYNVELYVKECILSVFAQDYQNIELIAVDDCGTDNSIAILEELFKSNPQNISCILLHHDKNRGLSAARNTGTKYSHGKYILYLDSDDALQPFAISHLVNKIKATDSDIVVFDFYSDEENKGIGGNLCDKVSFLNSNAECIHGLAELWFPVTAWSKFLKKSFIEHNQLEFKEGIINEDAPWTFQVCLAANSIAFLNEKLYYYRYNPNSIMSTKKQKDMNKAGLYTLQMMKSKLDERMDLKGNKDAYLIWMRQIVLFYTRVFNHSDFNTFVAFCSKLDYLKVSFSKQIVPPLYYKLWNLAFKLPNCIKPLFLGPIIKIHKVL